MTAVIPLITLAIQILLPSILTRKIQLEGKGEFMKRIKYFFDRKIASGTGPLLLWVGILSFSCLIVFATIWTFIITDRVGKPQSFIETFWVALGVAIDPGLVLEPGWPNRIFLFLVAIFGIFFLSTLIGILTSGLTEKLYDLRRGRSLVLEEGHTIILGWSAKIGPIISELILANLSVKRAKIVVLADIDKIKMEEYIYSIVGRKHTTEIICRNGTHTEIQNIKILNPENSKSIIILKENNNPDDTPTIKSILALKKILKVESSIPIITEISDPQNIEAALSIDPNIAIVRPNELITRLIVQSARQPGLSKVYDELLSFKGNEIYFHCSKFLKPLAFGEVIQRYQNAVAIGIYTTQDEMILCPKSNVIVEESDQIIVIAEDDDEIIINDEPVDFIPMTSIKPPEENNIPEHIWILGWHQLGKILLEEFNSLLPEGSTISIIYDDKFTNSTPEIDGLTTKYKLKSITGDTTKKETINNIDFKNCTHIIVMSYRDILSSAKADDKSLLSMIHLRNLCKKYPNISLTSELINFENKELISDTDENNDFVASEEIVSQALVQLAENPKIEKLLTKILTADGPEFHIRKASQYPNALNFEDLSNICLSFGEIAIGYRKQNKIILNPDKKAGISLIGTDGIIVFAEE
jgi:Trk K+ transport system NAD-binding subunit